jgi:ubiquinone/menaquinone biosynthesis C-methylase UbiE
MMYIPNMKDTASEITRVLKKGGTLRIIDHAEPKKKTLFTAVVFLFVQASGHLIHDYEFYFSKHLKLIKHKTLGRGGYMQLFDFKKV